MSFSWGGTRVRFAFQGDPHSLSGDLTMVWRWKVGMEVGRPAGTSTRVVMGEGQEPGCSIDRLALRGRLWYRYL